MAIEYYKEQPVPVFESILKHDDAVYGLQSCQTGYLLYEIDKTPMKIRMHIVVEEGTELYLGKNEEGLGVCSVIPGGSKREFMLLPLFDKTSKGGKA